MKKIVNLTQNDVVLVMEDGSKVTFEKSGKVARIVEEISRTYSEDEIGYPLLRKEFGGVDSEFAIGRERKDTVFIVSLPGLQCLKHRNDIISPDTGPDSVVRDEEGRIIGVKRFMKM